MRSRYNPKGVSGQEGLSAEKLFRLISQKNGYKYTDSPTNWNVHKHIDCILENEKGETKTVDIKALKRTSRSNDVSQNQEIWIEFKNVGGRKGWLYGEADIIAFQDDTMSFLAVNRVELKDLCEELVDLDDEVEASKNALYKAYTRKGWGRKDVISRIKRSDIIGRIKYMIFK